MTISPQIELIEAQTQALLTWAKTIERDSPSPYAAGQQLVRKLGAHHRADGLTEFGFWLPNATAAHFVLEIFTPLNPIDFRLANQEMSCRRDRLAFPRQGEFVWGVVAGLKAGDRTNTGSFYWLRQGDTEQPQQIIRDVLAYSLPYGIFAPAELYDMEKLQGDRRDLDYFRANPEIKPPTNILQIHVGTASKSGTFAGLNQIYQDLSRKLANKQPLTAAEKNYVGFDAIELLPIEPTVEYVPEGETMHQRFWQVLSESNQYVQVKLQKPDVKNWGYDDPLIGAAAVSPSQLSSLRPTEIVDFIATLHNFSQGPIQIIFDLVYGHIHEQGLQLIDATFCRGDNMYGQDTNQQQPMVRAILLELERRKINLGADGIRVDGGQDFQLWDESGKLDYDTEFLLAMGEVKQEISTRQNGALQSHCRNILAIYEDGRPWPNQGWEHKATYRNLIEKKPDCFQWSPLIFEHNTPTLQGFWLRKWRDMSRIVWEGDRWITGYANHDTVRKSNQIDVKTTRINEFFGETLPEILRNAYDNPATQLWIYGFCPGLPMDFLNALMHAPWGFFRNTDDHYIVKIAAAEIGFLYWQVAPELYAKPWAFRQLKTFGFRTLKQARHLFKTLEQAIAALDYNLEKIAEFCHAELSPHYPGLGNLDVSQLKQITAAFVEDGHEISRVHHYSDAVPGDRCNFNFELRQYRHDHRWLKENLCFEQGDRFHHMSDDQRTVFYGIRTNPVTQQRIAMVVHMAGAPTTVTLGAWLCLDLAQWQLAIATPELAMTASTNFAEIRLRNGEGFMLTTEPP
ncbi:MAG: glucosylglycerol hydrolase [Limnothrix sp.]